MGLFLGRHLAFGGDSALAMESFSGLQDRRTNDVSRLGVHNIYVAILKTVMA